LRRFLGLRSRRLALLLLGSWWLGRRALRNVLRRLGGEGVGRQDADTHERESEHGALAATIAVAL
jgi:hypothetical protein